MLRHWLRRLWKFNSCTQTAGRDWSSWLQAEIAILIGPCTAVIIGLTKFCLLDLHQVDGICHVGMKISQWQADSFVLMMSLCWWLADDGPRTVLQQRYQCTHLFNWINKTVRDKSLLLGCCLPGAVNLFFFCCCFGWEAWKEKQRTRGIKKSDFIRSDNYQIPKKKKKTTE